MYTERERPRNGLFNDNFKALHRLISLRGLAIDTSDDQASLPSVIVCMLSNQKDQLIFLVQQEFTFKHIQPAMLAVSESKTVTSHL